MRKCIGVILSEKSEGKYSRQRDMAGRNLLRGEWQETRVQRSAEVKQCRSMDLRRVNDFILFGKESYEDEKSTRSTLCGDLEWQVDTAG